MILVIEVERRYDEQVVLLLLVLCVGDVHFEGRVAADMVNDFRTVDPDHHGLMVDSAKVYEYTFALIEGGAEAAGIKYQAMSCCEGSLMPDLRASSGAQRGR